MDPAYMIFLGICVLNPCLQNVGMGMQKWAIDRTPRAADTVGKAGWVGVWIVGLLFQIIVVLLAFKALTLGNASTLGAFAGLGLIFLALFSFLVLKEKILRKELVGIALIMAGTVVLGYFSHGSQSPDVHMQTSRTYGFFGAYMGLVLVGLVMLKFHLHTFGGGILGLIGGSMNGVGVVTQKIVTHTAVQMNIDFSSFAAFWSTLVVLLGNVYTWLMVIGGVGGFIVIQIGYKYGKAVQVVPSHASMVVIVPALAGVVLLGETVPWVCWLCIAVITAGVIITTTADPSKHAA